MKYLVFVLILLASFQPFSFVIYNWHNKNKKAAVGVILLILLSFIMPFIAMVSHA